MSREAARDEQKAIWKRLQSLEKHLDAEAKTDTAPWKARKAELKSQLSAVGKDIKSNKAVLAKALDRVKKFEAAIGSVPGDEALREEGAALWDEVAELEADAQSLEQESDTLKQELYFPDHAGYRWKFGSNGVYVGMKDFWIPEVSGQVHINMYPPSETQPAHLRVDCCGTDAKRGIALQARAFSLGIKGEKGTRVPDLTIDELSLAVEVVASMPLEFNSHHKWQMGSGFCFRLVKLEKRITGGISVPKRILKWLVNWLVPKAIKTALPEALPNELGMLLRQQSAHLSLTSKVLLRSISFGCLDAHFEDCQSEPMQAGAKVQTPLESVEEKSDSPPPPPPAPPLGTLLGASAIHDAMEEPSFDSELPDPTSFEVAWRTILNAGSAVKYRLDSNSKKPEAVTPRVSTVPKMMRMPSMTSAVAAPTAHQANVALEWLQLSHPQIMLLMRSQLAVARKKKSCRMLCLGDVLSYSRKIMRHSDPDSIIQEWQHLVDIQKQLEGTETALDVAAMFQQAKIVCQKPMKLYLLVSKLQGRVVADDAVAALYALSKRVIHQEQAKRTKKESKARPMGVDMAPKWREHDADVSPARASVVSTSSVGSVQMQSPGSTQVGSGSGSGAGLSTPRTHHSTALSSSSIQTPGSSRPRAMSVGSESSTSTRRHVGLRRQLIQLEEWLKTSEQGLALVHASLKHCGAFVEGGLLGGENGVLAVSLRQVEALSALNLSLPVILGQAVYPPSPATVRTQVNDDGSYNVDLLLPAVSAATPARVLPQTLDSVATISVGEAEVAVRVVGPSTGPFDALKLSFAAAPGGFRLGVDCLNTRVAMTAARVTMAGEIPVLLSQVRHMLAESSLSPVRHESEISLGVDPVEAASRLVSKYIQADGVILSCRLHGVAEVFNRVFLEGRAKQPACTALWLAVDSVQPVDLKGPLPVQEEFHVAVGDDSDSDEEDDEDDTFEVHDASGLVAPFDSSALSFRLHFTLFELIDDIASLVPGQTTSLT